MRHALHTRPPRQADLRPPLAVSSSLSDLDFLNQSLAQPRQPNGQAPAPVPQQQATPATASSQPAPRPDASSTSSSPTSDTTVPPHLASLLATLSSTSASATSILGSSPLINADPDAAPPDDLSDEALAQLLAKLDDAEGAAEDLEGRLDGLLSNLDSMLGALGALEPQEGEGAGEDEAQQVVDGAEGEKARD